MFIVGGEGVLNEWSLFKGKNPCLNIVRRVAPVQRGGGGGEGQGVWAHTVEIEKKKGHQSKF